MPADAVTSQWLRGVTDLVLLAALETGPSYGYALVERLGRAGLAPIGEATVYGALRRLEGAALCDSTLFASDSGPARRYYRLTDAGRDQLRALRGAWAQFTAAVGRVTGIDAHTAADTDRDRGQRHA